MNEPADYLSPGKATDFAGERIRRAGGVAFQYAFSGVGFAITEDRRLLTWGRSKQAVAYPGPVPVAVAGLENVSSASAIQDHLCAVADGRLYCWGRNGLKACSGTADVIMSPLEIRTQGKAPAQQVALQYDNTCVRLTDGTVECCGNDNLGQLGTGEHRRGRAGVRSRVDQGDGLHGARGSDRPRRHHGLRARPGRNGAVLGRQRGRSARSGHARYRTPSRPRHRQVRLNDWKLAPCGSHRAERGETS